MKTRLNTKVIETKEYYVYSYEMYPNNLVKQFWSTHKPNAKFHTYATEQEAISALQLNIKRNIKRLTRDINRYKKYIKRMSSDIIKYKKLCN